MHTHARTCARAHTRTRARAHAHACAGRQVHPISSGGKRPMERSEPRLQRHRTRARTHTHKRERMQTPKPGHAHSCVIIRALVREGACTRAASFYIRRRAVRAECTGFPAQVPEKRLPQASVVHRL
jgi:hypothetical protein